MEEKSKMKNKILLLGLVILGIVMCTSMASAVTDCGPYGYCYGGWPINPGTGNGYYTNIQTPVRVGGFYGQNSAFLIGLRPGVYDGPVWNMQTRYNIASAYYPRVGGWFGYSPYNNYYNLRSGMFTFGGYGYDGYAQNYGNVPYVYHGPL
jgi:hypothetical protein